MTAQLKQEGTISAPPQRYLSTENPNVDDSNRIAPLHPQLSKRVAMLPLEDPSASNAHIVTTSCQECHPTSLWRIS